MSVKLSMSFFTFLLYHIVSVSAIMMRLFLMKLFDLLQTYKFISIPLLTPFLKKIKNGVSFL